jgi:hypothetical protein
VWELPQKCKGDLLARRLAALQDARSLEELQCAVSIRRLP